MTGNFAGAITFVMSIVVVIVHFQQHYKGGSPFMEGLTFKEGK